MPFERPEFNLEDQYETESSGVVPTSSEYVTENDDDDGGDEEDSGPPRPKRSRSEPSFQDQGLQRQAIQPRPQVIQAIPQAISQDQAKARMVIDQVQQLYTTQETQMEQMRQIQQQLVLQPQPDGVRQLQEQQWKLNQQIELELKEVQGLHRSVILDPPALHQLRMLLQRLKIQQQKIELFRQELQIIANPRPTPSWFVCEHSDPPNTPPPT